MHVHACRWASRSSGRTPTISRGWQVSVSMQVFHFVFVLLSMPCELDLRARLCHRLLHQMCLFHGHKFCDPNFFIFATEYVCSVGCVYTGHCACTCTANINQLRLYVYVKERLCIVCVFLHACRCVCVSARNYLCSTRYMCHSLHRDMLFL
jgi:hypothetical protein